MENTTLNRGTSRDEYNAQGKSNRFLYAQEQGKMTAGEAAKVLTKRFGTKILASDIEPLAVEFHHAGRFGNNKAKRIFFFSDEDLARITLEQVEELREGVWGWILGFTPVLGRYGRKSYLPTVKEAGCFPSAKAHRLGDKFHQLPRAEVEELLEAGAVGKVLPAYETDWRKAT